MMKIVCGKENINEFNRQFKAVAPEFHALAKELHASGLIDGLRGATLEFGDFSVTEPTEQPAASYCKACRHWHKPNDCQAQS